MFAMARTLILAGSAFAAAGAYAADFTVTSSNVKDTLGQAEFANSFGCSGGNLSPQLSWKNAPAETKSFAVSIFDPDAPTGSGWWHWIVANIPAKVTELPKGAGSQGGVMPEGSFTATNDAGTPGYIGACPPAGQIHRYVVTVKALKVEKLDLPPNASGALVGFMTNMNKIGEATIVFTAGR
jgi:Raf kinase inhibitor-like YbhB/YbcL family protein